MLKSQPVVSMNSDRTVSVSGIAGWPNTRFEGIRVKVIDGRAEIVSLRITASDAAITTEMLARVPLKRLASIAALWSFDAEPVEGAMDLSTLMFDQIHRLKQERVKRGYGVSAEFCHDVEQVVAWAKVRRIPIDDAVAKAWNVSIPSAKNYIREAREFREGLIVERVKRPRKVAGTSVTRSNIATPGPILEPDDPRIVRGVASTRVPGKNSTKGLTK